MDLRTYTREYTKKDNRLAALSYFGTFAVYFLSLYLAIAYVERWYILIPAGVIFAFAAVRLYVLQHDTGHHSLFETRRQNEIAGHVLSPFTFAPFEVMKQNHNLHHANIGNLEHRETGEIHTMTLREWKEAGFWERLTYRLYRNPLVLVPVGSAFTYFIRYRWPKNTTKFGILGVLLHNMVIIALISLLYYVAGPTGLWVWLAFSFLGGMIGVFLVYLQHNFEDTYWDRRPDLNPQEAALQGSSCLDFGWFFDFAVANITLHDIHHFNARIPSYRLRKCHYNLPPEFALRRISFDEALRALSLKLWDEEQKRLVPFPA
ncbi:MULTISPECIES: fatty acid desaturase [Rhodobacterales]|jgi:omega-6 fatty acid desaturase (delta-12 desaturase)|uniref:Fatty acid desaturase n=1 Tax=Phaeobacter gallaeciensis TaxID=60890 RepID=A0A1B0ZMJ6_9RHOB|nr:MULTISPECIES: fatty acid desaturase [Phaeobacter]MEE2634238.1 fatty acid desaturase [Pseudomonadota bacterium]ANP35338.1 fatty acid desaturase [Phaeobacter gallaeciensis]MDE4062585.1 fatty acid desaturase [Phaeobacter gallaeciensis]MDE4125511.1 fatty acid desaturase [Phaeobacter gallaeciensis]MDE4130079.1 fatty acid desaturase [Phaeobacter gallaeciensis]